jgi:hypothetical protein
VWRNGKNVLDFKCKLDCVDLPVHLVGSFMLSQMTEFFLFFMTEWYIIVHICHIYFIHPSAEGHLG